LGSDEPTVDTFYRLAFERRLQRAYLSFPMTAVARLQSVTQEIGEFRRRMKELFICFDPGDLEEAHLPMIAREAHKQGLKQVEITAGHERAVLDVEEVLQIERDINNQIYARDFLLIDQADMIVSFVPAMPDGRAAISSGVERELQHAHEAAKEVYVIWTAQQSPSVFVTQTANRVFSRVTEATESSIFLPPHDIRVPLPSTASSLSLRTGSNPARQGRYYIPSALPMLHLPCILE
jgi:hypothetical protein